MKRRSRAGGEPISGRRPKTSGPKRGNAPNVQARFKLSPATEETEVARLTRELSEERKQRAATSEVLHLLSGSHGDLNRLFDTILSNATKLCQANFGTLSLYEGDAFRIVAMHNAPPAYGEHRQREPLVRGRPLLRMAETKQLVHIADLREYVASNPADEDAATFAKLSGVRTVLIVPMLKEGEVEDEPRAGYALGVHYANSVDLNYPGSGGVGGMDAAQTLYLSNHRDTEHLRIMSHLVF